MVGNIAFTAALNNSLKHLLSLFDYHGRPVPLLVEVKSSSKMELRFTQGYYEKLRSYADVLGLPLLIAFKSTLWDNSWWCLFEIECMRSSTGSLRAKVPQIFVHDLSGILLGNFHVKVRQGTTISMTTTKEQVHSEDSFVGRLIDVHWETPEGERADPDWLLHWLFMLSQDEVEVEESPDTLIERFRKAGDESVNASWAMYAALPVNNYKVGGQTNWAKLLDEYKFQFTLGDLLNAARSATGLVDTIIHQKPHTVPEFLVN
jgi:Holliday junction resolvase